MPPPTLQLRVHAPVGALQLAVQLAVTTPWTVLFGPSGSGKSSLLRLTAGLWTPPGASVLLNGEDLTRVPPHKRRIALVAQQVALFPHMSVRQNIAFGCRDGSDKAAVVERLLHTFHLSALAAARPGTLSGGERQRAALARALATAPRMLLLDEVFTGMHATLRRDLVATLRDYSAQHTMPVLSVTHDVAEALGADQAIKLHEGKITAQGTPATVFAEERESLLQSLSAGSRS